MCNILSTSLMPWVQNGRTGWIRRNMANKFLGKWETKTEALANFNLVSDPRASKCLTWLN